MTSLVNKSKSETVCILDARAGTGILTASAALRCFGLGCKTIHAVLYELDTEVASNLKRTLQIIQNAFGQQRGTFTFEIHSEDFVLARQTKMKALKASMFPLLTHLTLNTVLKICFIQEKWLAFITVTQTFPFFLSHCYGFYERITVQARYFWLWQI